MPKATDRSPIYMYAPTRMYLCLGNTKSQSVFFLLSKELNMGVCKQDATSDEAL